MPRGFSKLEAKHFRDKLLDIGTFLFGTKGLSGVSIDQIVKEVGISKGSFYRFFKNKEDLCYDCLLNLETNIRRDIEKKLLPHKDQPGVFIKLLILEIPRVIKDHPLLSMFQNPREMELLMLRVDPGKHQVNFDGDTGFIGSMLNGTEILRKTDKESLAGFLWAMVLISLNENFFNGQFNNIINFIGDMATSHFENRGADSDQSRKS